MSLVTKFGKMMFFLLFLATIVGSTLSTGNQIENEDYAPCLSNVLVGYGQTIDCQGISAEDIITVFNRTSEKQLQEVEFNLFESGDETFIPADLLAEKLVTKIKMSCQNPNRKPSDLIEVNQDAFRSTRNQTTHFEIKDCPISQLNFLTGFDQLTKLKITSTGSAQRSLEGLPPLKSLSELEISISPELNDVIHFPKLVNGLRSISLLYNSELDDEMASRILNWLAKSSVETLESFGVLGSVLTKVPQQLNQFQKLTSVVLNKQTISTVTSGSISSSSSFKYVGFVGSEVNIIEPGAFHGDFGDANVDLTGNKLTRLDSEVFRTMVQQMASSPVSRGSLILYGNPIDCVSDPCHLAWLIRDDPTLLKPIEEARCSNGTLLTELDPQGLNHCPVSPQVIDSTLDKVVTLKSPDSSVDTVVLIERLEYPKCRLFHRSLTCKGIATTEVRDAFKRNGNNADLSNLELILPGQDTTLPANFINTVDGNARFFQIKLTCRSTQYKLRVDQDAFRTSRDDTAVIYIKQCNLAEVDFSFLTGFDQLVTLHISRSANIHHSFSTLPPLKSLTTLVLQSTTKIEELNQFPVLVNGLKYLRVADVYSLNDDKLSAVLNWVQNSSADTLETLVINAQTTLSGVPKEMISFRKVKNLHLEENNLKTLTSGSIVLSAPVENVFLMDSKIQTIEPNAFQGDFSNATVHLYNNELTRFEESVFKTMLEQMTSPYSTGSIILHGNSFDCDTDICHLTWLVLLNPELLKAVKGGKCSNGLNFEELGTDSHYFCQPWQLIKKDASSVCSQDYSPCSCLTDSRENHLDCNRNSMTETLHVLNREQPTKMILHLVLSPNDTDIVPVDVFKTHKFKLFFLVCPSPDYQLKVGKRDNTTKYVEQLMISGCDLSQLDLSFLADFEELEGIFFFQSTNLHATFHSLPTQNLKNSFEGIVFLACRGLNELTRFPEPILGGLRNLILISNYDLDDEAVSRIVSWAVHEDTTDMLVINSNRNLKRIPPEISRFKKITTLFFNQNGATPFLDSSFPVLSPAKRMYFEHSRIDSIPSGTFQGNFNETIKISLKNNRLTRFESSVFKSVLQQMKDGQNNWYSTAVEIHNNPIDCISDHCHLAWLIRDEPDLLQHVKGGRCSNGTRFQDLHPNGFDDCQVLIE